MMSRVLHNLANYDSTIQPVPDAPEVDGGKKPKKVVIRYTTFLRDSLRMKSTKMLKTVWHIESEQTSHGLAQLRG